MNGIRHTFVRTWERCYAMQLTTGLKTYLCFEKDKQSDRLPNCRALEILGKWRQLRYSPTMVMQEIICSRYQYIVPTSKCRSERYDRFSFSYRKGDFGVRTREVKSAWQVQRDET